MVGGFISHLEQIWEEPDLRHFLERLSRVGRVVVYDKRGLGLSDRVGIPPSREEHVADALAVAHAAGARRMVVLSVSDGAPIGVQLAAEHPEQVGW